MFKLFKQLARLTLEGSKWGAALRENLRWPGNRNVRNTEGWNVFQEISEHGGLETQERDPRLQ